MLDLTKHFQLNLDSIFPLPNFLILIDNVNKSFSDWLWTKTWFSDILRSFVIKFHSWNLDSIFIFCWLLTFFFWQQIFYLGSWQNKLHFLQKVNFHQIISVWATIDRFHIKTNHFIQKFLIQEFVMKQLLELKHVLNISFSYWFFVHR